MSVLLFKHRYAAIALSLAAPAATAAAVCYFNCLLPCALWIAIQLIVVEKEFTTADTVRYINHVRWLKCDPVTVLTSAQSHSFD